MQHWTFVDALYFCVVLVSTVGYGANLIPDSPATRIFSIYFAVVGIFVFAVLTRSAAALIATVQAWFAKVRRSMMERALPPPARAMLKRQLNTPEDYVHLDPAKMLLVRTLRFFMGFIAFNYFSAVTFTATEENVSRPTLHKLALCMPLHPPGG